MPALTQIKSETKKQSALLLEKARVNYPIPSATGLTVQDIRSVYDVFEDENYFTFDPMPMALACCTCTPCCSTGVSVIKPMK